jgi:serine/threonine protein kinase
MGKVCSVRPTRRLFCKAHETVIDGGVAIKALPTKPDTEPGYRQRFHREARTAARLTEPHSIPIYDTGDIDGQLYLVLPIIERIDVHGLLKRDGPISPHRALHIIEQLACAQDGAQPQGFAKESSKNSARRPPQPACENGLRAATTDI